MAVVTRDAREAGPMSDNYFTSSDDDLPRTVRLRKEEMARAEAARHHYAGGPTGLDDDYPGFKPPGGERVTVDRLEIPFFHLMKFFIKAVFAAIPALLLAVPLLMGIFLLASKVVDHYLPWLVKMRIVINYG